MTIRSGINGPGRALIGAREAAQSVCRTGFKAIGCAGRADRIKPLPLEAMVKRCR